MLLAAVICLMPAGYSYVSAMTGRYNVGLGVESVEWLRNNGGNGLVSQIENWYYTLNAPSKGGPTTRSLPQVGVHAAASQASRSSRSARHRRPAQPYTPPNIRPVILPPCRARASGARRPPSAGRPPPCDGHDVP